jgi:protein-L-isoaspartate(D-aspartate) O-methyltransferase
MLALSPTFDGKRTVPSIEVTRLMADLLKLKPEDKLLEIGTGSGYQTKTWAQSGCEVHSIELEPFIDSTVVTGPYVYLHRGDGVIGMAQEAPFTAIVATCGVEEIPKAWKDQLADGGRLVVPLGDNVAQRLTLFRKENTELLPIRVAAYCRFQMLRSAA